MDESQSREQYSEILDRVQRDEDQVIIEKKGVPVAAIVPMSVLRDAESTARRRANLRAAFQSTREEFRDIPPDEIEHEIEKAIAEIGEARRQRRDRGSALAEQ